MYSLILTILLQIRFTVRAVSDTFRPADDFRSGCLLYYIITFHLIILIRKRYNVKYTTTERGKDCYMIKAAFCDDDASVLDSLKDLVDRYCRKRGQEIEYNAFCNSLELLAEIERGMRYDILFLDVILPNENGISIAKEIRQYDSVVKIIFLTSSSEFAVQSYAVDAYFYQMKPIREESFFSLLDSAISKCRKEQQRSLIQRCKNGITRIELDRLEYCEVIGRTLMFHMEDGIVLEGAGSMDKLCEQLSQYENFVRPHRSFLVNMEYIQKISHKTVTMKSQAELPIPHGKSSRIKNMYLEYAFNRKQVFIL